MKKLFSFLILLALSMNLLVVDHVQALSNSGHNSLAPKDKVASDLRQRMKQSQSSDTGETVILQLNGSASQQLATLLKRNGVKVKWFFDRFNAFAVHLPYSAIKELEAFPEVSFVAPDRKLNALGHLSTTTGADSVRLVINTNTYGLDGTGVGIAVLDSGMDPNHVAFLDRLGNSRIRYSQDFTGEGRTDDPYGHGTHVATVAAGNGRVSNAAYLGVAPNANLINLRVLNSQGTGTTSSVLNALNWVLANSSTYNIRVVNMSLGMPAVDSYKNDPVCLAVRKLVDAGIVVVAAAGNNGKDANGNKVYGMIHSPGDEPSAITVGAANTFGTDARNDDGVTTYSSRGPTRGYWTDIAGVKHYDNLIKPDLVAPGNKIIEAEAANNLIVRQNPQLDAGVSTITSRKYMYLNGTSMASPAVAGAAAMLLQANPKLTPNMVKMILEYTAQRLAGFNTFEQGAGELNIEGATRLALLVRQDLNSLTPVGTPLLTSLTLPVQQTTIAGYTFPWSQGVITNYNYLTGTALISNYQKIYATGTLLSDGVLLTDGVFVGDNTLLSSSVLIGDNIMTSAGTLIGDGTVFCSDGVLITDSVLIGDGVLFGDGVIISDSVLVGDGVIAGDYTLQALAAVSGGDNTASMLVQPDTGVDFLNY